MIYPILFIICVVKTQSPTVSLIFTMSVAMGIRCIFLSYEDDEVDKKDNERDEERSDNTPIFCDNDSQRS